MTWHIRVGPADRHEVTAASQLGLDTLGHRVARRVARERAAAAAAAAAFARKEDAARVGARDDVEVGSVARGVEVRRVRRAALALMMTVTMAMAMTMVTTMMTLMTMMMPRTAMMMAMVM